MTEKLNEQIRLRKIAEEEMHKANTQMYKLEENSRLIALSLEENAKKVMESKYLINNSKILLQYPNLLLYS